MEALRSTDLPSLRDLEIPTLSTGSYAELLDVVSTRITSLTIDETYLNEMTERDQMGSTAIAALICRIGPQLRRLDLAASSTTFTVSDMDLIVCRFTGLNVLCVDTVDISPLAALTTLRKFHIVCNYVHGGSALASLAGLEALILDGVVVDGLAALAHLSRLTQLYICYHGDTDISGRIHCKLEATHPANVRPHAKCHA
jgi:hypothetical protein